jgi:hypothetical protein
VPIDFRQRAAEIEAQLAKVREDLKTADPADHVRLQALAASLRRSLRWYTARAGTRSDVHALSVNVAEVIQTTSGT